MSLEQIIVDDFEFLVNKDEVAIAIDLNEGNVTSAELLYDGRNCAVLIRNNEKMFLLTNIIPPMREKLKNMDTVFVLERIGTNHEIVNAYTVDIHHVSEMPYPDNFIEDTKKYYQEITAEIGKDNMDKFLNDLEKVYAKEQ